MEKFIKIEINTGSSERSEILIAELSEVNFYAFEENKNELIAYITQGKFNEQKLQEILSNNENYRIMIIDNKNWNQEWESGFQPVCIDSFVGIRASFHQPLRNVKHEIIITPKMSFGTGHHATTSLMIEQMATIDFINKTVVDFGTGTGVLAILAEKLGAETVIAIDNDEWSIDNAFENIKKNNCKQITVVKTDTVADLAQPDIILANINLNILIESSINFSLISRSGTLLLISGFFHKNEEAILNGFNTCGFKKTSLREREGWASLLLKKE